MSITKLIQVLYVMTLGHNRNLKSKLFFPVCVQVLYKYVILLNYFI